MRQEGAISITRIIPVERTGHGQVGDIGLLHLGIAFGVSYALTGSLAVAGAITLLEPVLNTVAHFFFDRWWERRRGGRARGQGTAVQPAGAAS